MTREAKEGVIAVSGNSEKTSIIEINCETDFVAKNKNFIDFVKEISDLNNQINSENENVRDGLHNALSNVATIHTKGTGVTDVLEGKLIIVEGSTVVNYKGYVMYKLDNGKWTNFAGWKKHYPNRKEEDAKKDKVTKRDIPKA